MASPALPHPSFPTSGAFGPGITSARTSEPFPHDAEFLPLLDQAYSWSEPIKVNLKVGRHILPSRLHQNWTIDRSWFAGRADLRWNGRLLAWPESLDRTWFDDIRGKDSPDFKIPGRITRNYSCPPPLAPANCTFVFSEDRGYSQTWGSNFAKVYQGQVKTRIACESQVPSLVLQFKTQPVAGERIVRYRLHLFGNKTMRDAKFIGPADFTNGKNAALVPPEHRQAANEGKLLYIRVRFGAFDSSSPRLLNSVVCAHGEGNSEVGFDRWTSDEDMMNCLRNNPQGFDAVVHDLLSKSNISLEFFRSMNEKAAEFTPLYHLQSAYWQSIMNVCCRHGPFWFYSIQPSFSREAVGAHFGTWKEPRSPPPVPFWLLRKCIAHVTEDGLVKLEPIEWAPIVISGGNDTSAREARLPHSDLVSFLHELSHQQQPQRQPEQRDRRPANPLKRTLETTLAGPQGTASSAGSVAPKRPKTVCHSCWEPHHKRDNCPHGWLMFSERRRRYDEFAAKYGNHWEQFAPRSNR